MNIRQIAHRGFSSEAPENTRVSFALAAEGNFYGIECDIWRSLDGVYVVSHDGNLNRMCGVDKWIPRMVFPEIRQYPVVRGKKRLMYPVQYLISFQEYLSLLARSDIKHPVVELKMDYTGEQLEEIIDLVKEADSYGKGMVKTKTRERPTDQCRADGSLPEPVLEDRNYRTSEMCSLNEIKSLYDRTIFISMHQSVLLRLKNELHFPPERLQFVYGIPRPYKTLPVGENVERWLIENRINLDSRYTLLSPGNVIRLHKEGIKVNVWTVNKRKDLNQLEQMGVDMVTTEYYFRDDVYCKGQI